MESLSYASVLATTSHLSYMLYKRSQLLRKGVYGTRSGSTEIKQTNRPVNGLKFNDKHTILKLPGNIIAKDFLIADHPIGRSYITKADQADILRRYFPQMKSFVLPVKIDNYYLAPNVFYIHHKNIGVIGTQRKDVINRYIWLKSKSGLLLGCGVIGVCECAKKYLPEKSLIDLKKSGRRPLPPYT